MEPEPIQSPTPVTAAPAAPAPAAAPVSEPKKNAAYGTILGIVLIVAILVVGAFYVWGERLDREHAQPESQDAVRGSLDAEAPVPQPN